MCLFCDFLVQQRFLQLLTDQLILRFLHLVDELVRCVEVRVYLLRLTINAVIERFDSAQDLEPMPIEADSQQLHEDTAIVIELLR